MYKMPKFKVCGNPGTVSFSSPEYEAFEDSYAWAGVYVAASYGAVTTNGTVRVTVTRTGGGYGTVGVRYQLRHGTTDAADVTSHAHYTTRCGCFSQKASHQAAVVAAVCSLFVGRYAPGALEY